MIMEGILIVLAIVGLVLMAMAAVETADPLLSIQVIPSVKVSSVDTAFQHLVSCVWRHTNVYSETYTPGTGKYIDRAVSHMDTGAVLVVETPVTADPAILELYVAMDAGATEEFTLLETTGYRKFVVEMFCELEANVQIGPNRYRQTWTLTPSGAPTVTTV